MPGKRFDPEADWNPPGEFDWDPGLVEVWDTSFPERLWEDRTAQALFENGWNYSGAMRDVSHEDRARIRETFWDYVYKHYKIRESEFDWADYRIWYDDKYSERSRSGRRR